MAVSFARDEKIREWKIKKKLYIKKYVFQSIIRFVIVDVPLIIKYRHLRDMMHNILNLNFTSDAKI